MPAFLYAEIYLICLIVCGILIFWNYRSRMLSTAERWLGRMLFAFFCNFLSNFCFTLLSSGLMDRQHTAAILFKALYFVTLQYGVFTWCAYAELEQKKSFLHHGNRRLLCIAAAVIPVLVAVLDLKTHLLFSLDGGIYRRHILYHVLMVFLIAISGLCAFRMLHQGRSESDPARLSHLRLTATFPLCILASWILSFIGETVPVICVCVMLELLLLYMGNLRLQISMDALTQVNNRQNLQSFMLYKSRTAGTDMYFMMIDIDDFKQINDHYGHPEGDEALVLVAKALKQACAPIRKRPYIARYGGDEFVIVAEGTQDDMLHLKNNILKSLETLKPVNCPYPVTLSIGMARFEKDMRLGDLIKRADMNMYGVKGRHKH